MIPKGIIILIFCQKLYLFFCSSYLGNLRKRDKNCVLGKVEWGRRLRSKWKKDLKHAFCVGVTISLVFKSLFLEPNLNETATQTMENIH